MKKKNIIRMLLCLVVGLSLFGCDSAGPKLKPMPTHEQLPTGVTLLTEIDPHYFENPFWSPDGKKLVGGYVVYAMADIAGSPPLSEILLVDLETGHAESLLKEDRNYFWTEGWGRDNQKIIIRSESGSFGSGCFSLKIDELIPEPAPYYYCGHSLSPDGTQYVAFENWGPYKKVELVIRDTQSGEGNVIYSLPVGDVVYEQRSGPDWSPDGGKLVFGLGIKTEKNQPAESDIYIIDIETRSVEKFISDPDNDDYSPEFSPNGDFIAHYVSRFTEDSKLHREVFVIRVDMTCQWKLPIGGSFDWSPDSTKLVISADDGVYIVDLPVFLGESFVNGTGCP